MQNKRNGFTLIEVMIVVTVIGILAAIAIPNYQESVRKSRRRDAQGALVSFANALERHFTENGSYCDAATTDVTGGGVTCTNATGAPTIFPTQSPVDGPTAYYNLSISAMNASGTSFTIQAVPIAGGPQANDSCGTMTLTQTGARNAAVANCW